MKKCNRGVERTPERCYQEALKCTTHKEFREKYASCYEKAKETGWINDYTWLKKSRKVPGYWMIYENVYEEAKKYDQVIVFSYNANVTPWQVEFINDIIKENKTFVISLKGPFDYHKYNNLQNYMCLYEYTPNSIKTVVKYLKGDLDPKGVLPIKL